MYSNDLSIKMWKNQKFSLNEKKSSLLSQNGYKKFTFFRQINVVFYMSVKKKDCTLFSHWFHDLFQLLSKNWYIHSIAETSFFCHFDLKIKKSFFHVDFTFFCHSLLKKRFSLCTWFFFLLLSKRNWYKSDWRPFWYF